MHAAPPPACAPLQNKFAPSAASSPLALFSASPDDAVRPRGQGRLEVQDWHKRASRPRALPVPLEVLRFAPRHERGRRLLALHASVLERAVPSSPLSLPLCALSCCPKLAASSSRCSSGSSASNHTHHADRRGRRGRCAPLRDERVDGADARGLRARLCVSSSRTSPTRTQPRTLIPRRPAQPPLSHLARRVQVLGSAPACP